MLGNEALLKWHCRPAVERPLRYARRLLAMGPGEITARLRQRDATLRSIAMPPWRVPDRPLLREWLEGRFLFGPARAPLIAEAWRRDRPEQAARLVERARQGLDRWEIFGVPVALEPGKIDWQEGGVRWVWELDRQQYLFTFARAFVLTGDPAYARRIAGLLEDWWRNNPAGRGVNWSSALEVGVRAISWLWTLPLLLDWAELEESFLRAWLASLHEHYQYLRNHLSLYLDPTNHLIGEAAALWLLSVALPDLPGAEREERRAIDVLGREIERQVTPDGVSREQSTGYQRLVLDFYLQVMAAARRAGRSLPPVVVRRVAAMLDFVALLAGEDGEVPAIGDSDDARAVPFPELSGWNFQDLLATGAAVLGRRYPGASAPEVAVWLAAPGPRPASGPLPVRLRVFTHGGYCFWQAEREGRRMGLLFDVGPLGLWPNASHGHADALSVQVKLDGHWLLADPGTGSYSDCGWMRDVLRGTASHNTVTIDEMDQADILGVFKWLKPVPTRLLDVSSGPEYDYAMAVHEGYHRLRQPVTHYRAVLFVRPPAPRAGWLVVDRLEGVGRHHCALRFHFPPGAEIHWEGPQTVVAAGLRLCFSEPLARREPGLWSPRFGHWERAPVLVLERSAELPLTWFTFLAPAGSDAGPHSVETARQGPSVLCRRRWAGGEETIEWVLERGRRRFRYRRTGARPGLFER